MTAPSDNPEHHDFSLLEKHAARQRTLSHANFVFKAGAAALLAGAGVGLAAYGISFAIEPKIITTERVVVSEKVVEVKVPQIVEKEIVKTVEVPKLVQAPTPMAAPAPSPQPTAKIPTPGDRLSQADFEQSSMFRDAPKCHGKLLSHRAGVMRFSDGSECYDVHPSGERDPRFSTTHYDGDQAVCNVTGEFFPNGKPRRRCYALHNGKVEDIAVERRAWLAQRSNPQPKAESLLDELFDNFDGPGG